MKKIVSLMIACTVVTGALFGCGGGGGGGSSDPGAPVKKEFAGIYTGTFTSYSTPFRPYHFSKLRMNVSSTMGLLGTGTISGHTDNDQTDGSISAAIDGFTGKFQLVQSQNGTGSNVVLDATVDASGNVTGTWVDTLHTGKSGNFSGSKVTFLTPRFTDNGNGTITDTATHLIWLKNANCYVNPLIAVSAESSVSALASGSTTCSGLTDNSTPGQWRMPTPAELLVFLDDGYSYATLSSAGFTNVQASPYWAGVDLYNSAGYYRTVDMSSGSVGSSQNTSYVWPVRSGP